MDAMSSLSSDEGTNDDDVSFTTAISHFETEDDVAGEEQPGDLVMRAILLGHNRPVVDLHFSPETADGHFLITSSEVAQLWNGETGNWVGTFKGHTGPVLSACLDQKALIAATASSDKSVKLWNALSGKQFQCFEHRNVVTACSISDSNILLTGGYDGSLRTYDLNQPTRPITRVVPSPGRVKCAAWLHPDIILSCCTDVGNVSIWDIRSNRTKEPVAKLPTASAISSVEVSRDRRYVLTTEASTVTMFDANSYGRVRDFKMPCTVASASLEPKRGLHFVAAGADSWIHVFNSFTGDEKARYKVRGHDGPVHGVRFAYNGESYASASDNGNVVLWSTHKDDADESEVLITV